MIARPQMSEIESKPIEIRGSKKLDTPRPFPAQAWPDESLKDNHQWTTRMVDASNNSQNLLDESPNTPLYQDPYVYLGAGDTEDDEDHFVSLAVNTNQ